MRHLPAVWSKKLIQMIGGYLDLIEFKKKNLNKSQLVLLHQDEISTFSILSGIQTPLSSNTF